MSARSFQNEFRFFLIILTFFGSYSIAHSGETLPTMKTYAEGRDWAVVTEVESRTCKIFIGNNTKSLVFGAFRPGGEIKYGVMVKDANWIPPEKPTEYKVSNENRMIFSLQGRGFKSKGPGGVLMIGLFGDEILRAISTSRILYVGSDGAADRRYNLTGAGDGFHRFFDCLKDAVNDKVPAAPAPRERRMN